MSFAPFFPTPLFRELMMAFGVPVFDRYSVVLQIFKDRARTREAKLQVAFAEIPYLRFISNFFKTSFIYIFFVHLPIL
jgi:hypothetical protein